MSDTPRTDALLLGEDDPVLAHHARELERIIRRCHEAIGEDAGSDDETLPDSIALHIREGRERIDELEADLAKATANHAADLSAAPEEGPRDAFEQGLRLGRLGYSTIDEVVAADEQIPERKALLDAAREWLLSAAPEATTSDAVREAVKRHVRAAAAHIKENADALKAFDWERNEARCRELCAMYLEEIALTMDMGDRIAELSRQRSGSMNLAPSKEG